MPIFIYGCGGHARSVCSVLRELSSCVEIILIDSNAGKDEYILGFPIKKEVKAKSFLNFYAVGDNFLRRQLFDSSSKNLIKIISKNAFIGMESHIEKGTFIGNFVNVGAESYIGENCIINTGAVIEHECKIGRHTHVAPNACICGRSDIGENVFVGAGTTIIDKIKVCSNVVIGAGAVVTKDIKEEGIYVGSPARKIR